MSYSVNTQASVQAVSSTGDLNTLVKYSLSSLSVDFPQTMTVELTANTPRTIDVSWFDLLKLVAVKGSAPIDLSVSDSSGTDHYSGFYSNFNMRVYDAGVAAVVIKLKSTVNCTCDLVLAGSAV